MRFKIANSSGKYGIYSVVKSRGSEEEIKNQGHSYWKIQENGVYSYPEEKLISMSDESYSKASELDDFDVIEVFPDGTVNQYYDDSSLENIFFITEKCNSNCIMCPSPDSSRLRGEMSSVENLIDLADHIPDDAGHFTITGGEPFMLGKRIFDFLSFLKNKFQRTEFQILTNGRIFAVEEYSNLLAANMPANTVLGIPVHASTSSIHDAITRAGGSFEQTVRGIKNLLERNVRIEIRIVVNAINAENLPALATMIIRDFPAVSHVSIMGMEMTGNAWVNRQKVWISYTEAFRYIRTAVNIMIDGGMDVWLYNFPLCTVDPELWALCKKSISSYKVKYKDECEKCRMKDACGGVFAGTYSIEEEEIRAIV